MPLPSGPRILTWVHSVSYLLLHQTFAAVFPAASILSPPLSPGPDSVALTKTGDMVFCKQLIDASGKAKQKVSIPVTKHLGIPTRGEL